jgi:putative Holliday junction resolvase
MKGLNNPPRVIMAFDFGLRNIGLAIGQEITRTAHTFYSVKAENGTPRWMVLDEIVNEWEPQLFVVGDPLNMDGSISKIKEKSDNFARKISSRYSIGYELMDERLSTKEATERLKKSGAEFKESMADKHSLSAQVILEDWFRGSQ